MAEKNLRELSLEEMDQVSGGAHDRTENRRYFIGVEVQCPYCRKTVFEDELQDHITKEHT